MGARTEPRRGHDRKRRDRLVGGSSVRDRLLLRAVRDLGRRLDALALRPAPAVRATKERAPEIEPSLVPQQAPVPLSRPAARAEPAASAHPLRARAPTKMICARALGRLPPAPYPWATRVCAARPRTRTRNERCAKSGAEAEPAPGPKPRAPCARHRCRPGSGGALRHHRRHGLYALCRRLDRSGASARHHALCVDRRLSRARGPHGATPTPSSGNRRRSRSAAAHRPRPVHQPDPDRDQYERKRERRLTRSPTASPRKSSRTGRQERERRERRRG